MVVAASALVLASVTAACGDDGDDVGTDSTTSAPTTTEADAMSDDGGDADAPTRAAIDDLVDRLDLDPSAVAIVSVDDVTWSDSSLGCPQEGFMYAQVLTDGTRIVLEADGERYEYHAAADADPFLCEDPQDPVPGG